MDRDWGWVWEDIAVLLFAGVGAGLAGLFWWRADGWMAGGISVWRITALASAIIAMMPPTRLILSVGFWILGIFDCTEACRSAVFLLLAFQGRSATSAAATIVAWSFSYQVLGILGSYPDGGGGTESRVRPGQEDNQAIIDQTFGCLLTVAVLLGARNALVRYVLWGVLQRQAQEQAAQLDRLQTVARRLTGPMRGGWRWPAEGPGAEAPAGGGESSNAGAGAGVGAVSGAGGRRPSVAPAPRRPAGPGAPPDGASLLRDLLSASAARLRMYDERGELHSVRREDRARLLARLAFRRACAAREAAGVRVGRLDRGRPGVHLGPQMPAWSGAGETAGEGGLGRGVTAGGDAAGDASSKAMGASSVGMRLRRGASAESVRGAQEASGDGAGDRSSGHRCKGKSRGIADGEVLGHESGTVDRVVVRAAENGRSMVDEDDDASSVGTADESSTPSAGLPQGMQAVVVQPYRWVRSLFAPTKVRHKDAQPGDDDLELLQDDFVVLIRDAEASEEAFRFFDTSEDGSVSITEFEVGFSKLLRAFSAAKGALAGHGTVSHAMDRFADSLFYVLAVVVVLIFYKIPVGSLFIPLSSMLLSLSFALGTTISNAVTSFVFVVMVHPYDVGDRISVPSINQGGTLVVEEIDVLTTTFNQPVTGKLLTIANHVLASQPIENLKRSPNVTFTVDVDLGRSTTAHQLSELKDAMLTYLAAFPKDWKPDLTLSALDALPGVGCMLRIRFWIRPRQSWQEGAKIYRARSAFVVALLAEMKRNKLEYVMPT